MAKVRNLDRVAVQFLSDTFEFGNFTPNRASDKAPHRDTPAGRMPTVNGIPASASGWERRLKTLSGKGYVVSVGGVWFVTDAGRDALEGAKVE